MSKPVRIRQDVIDRVGVLAESERRSLANMVEVLLEAALHDRVDARAVGETMALTRAVLTERGQRTNGALESGGADSTTPSSVPRSVSAESVPREEQYVGVDFVPPSTRTLPADKVGASFDRSVASRLALRDGKCSADVAHGTKCKLCGKVHG